MRLMIRGASVLVLLSALPSSTCRRGGADAGLSGPQSAAGTSPLDAAPATEPRPAGSAAVASTPVSASAAPTTSATQEPTGEATLILQRVDSDCGEGPKGRNFLGWDILVTTTGAAKPRQVFCPPGQRNLWQMCKRYQRCTVAADAGADRVVVTCDKDTITLESTPTGTRVTGPGATSVDLSPGPLRLTPPKKSQRFALVDC